MTTEFFQLAHHRNTALPRNTIVTMAYLYVFTECTILDSRIQCAVAVHVINQLIHLVKALESILLHKHSAPKQQLKPISSKFLFPVLPACGVPLPQIL